MTNALQKDQDELLCEACGYVLTGLPPGSNCPECGTPTEFSDPRHRQSPAIEQPGNPIAAFFTTTAQVLFSPSQFYRRLNTRHDRQISRRFGLIHQAIASLLLGIGLYAHVSRFRYLAGWWRLKSILDNPALAIPLYTACILLTLLLLTSAAARLTNWEARYRKMRLPLHTVLRGLDFHAVHYLPVALIGVATIVGYRTLIRLHLVNNWRHEIHYIYALCAEVILTAIYLFWTYWVGMRNMLYANA